jgi:hypothetical protein
VSATGDSTVSYYSQPVSLSVTSGLAASGENVTSVVEVATDATFSSIVTTKPIAAGPSTVTLDRLSASTTYYWRVKTTAGANAVVVSPSARFTIGPQLVIEAPVLVQPLADAFPHQRPTFVVKNAAHTGPPATLTYGFEVGTDQGFAAVVSRGTVPEGSGLTTFTPGESLIPGSTYVWRVRASDLSLGVTGDYSAPQVFTTIFPDAGSYRYTLVLRVPSLCLGLLASGYCGGQFPWPKSDFSFDGTLDVEGDTLRYRLPPQNNGVSKGPPLWEFTRTGSRLAGNISGTTPNTGGGDVTSVTMIGVATGDGDNHGRFDGTFDGKMSLWRFGFPCDRTWNCPIARFGEPWPDTPGFRWTLLPH